MKILRNFLTYLWFNLYFMAKSWRLKMLKRFRLGGRDSVTNPNPNIIRLAKIMNHNPNIWDLEEKIRIRIRLFVTTLTQLYGDNDRDSWRYGDAPHRGPRLSVCGHHPVSPGTGVVLQVTQVSTNGGFCTLSSVYSQI